MERRLDDESTTPRSDLHKALVAGGEEWRAAASRLGPDGLALQNANLVEADLADRDLSGLDLSDADLFRARLSRANLKKTVLRGAEIAHADMRGAALYKADLREAILQEADLENADLSATDCQGIDLRGANLRGVNFAGANLAFADFSNADLTGADLSGADVTNAKFHFAQLANVNATHIRYGSFRQMVGNFLGVRGVDQCYGSALFVRDAKDQDYIDTLHQSILDKPQGWVRRLDLMLFRAWALIDHGRSLLKVSAYATVLAMFYGFIYLSDMSFGWGIMDYSNSAETWFTPFYYSVVTYTTLGYGDVTANSLLGEILVISEVIVGYFTLGLLLAILANTIARRS